MSPLARIAVPLVALTAGLVSGVPAAAASADDTGAAVLERFEAVAAARGYELTDPNCQPDGADGNDFVCFARVGDNPGDLFIIRANVSPGAIAYTVVVEPSAASDDVGDGDSATPQPADFDAFDYFISVFSGNPKEFAELEAMTAPGSPAAAYLAFQREASETAAELGIELARATVYLTPRGPRMCPTPDSPCSEFTDIVVSEGLVEAFSVDGVPIVDRVGVAGDPVAVGDTMLRVAAAYRTISGDALAIYLEIDSTSPVALDLGTATYIAADGTQTAVGVDDSIGAILLGTSDEQVTVMLSFPGADPGGTLRFSIFPSDGSPALAAHVPVAAYGR